MRLGHRFYDASVGRFLSRDPIQDGRNWYAYCDNDPVNAVDPEGLKVYGFGAEAGVGIGAGFGSSAGLTGSVANGSLETAVHEEMAFSAFAGLGPGVSGSVTLDPETGSFGGSGGVGGGPKLVVESWQVFINLWDTVSNAF